MIVPVSKEKLIRSLAEDWIKYCGEITEIEQSTINCFTDSEYTIKKNRLVVYATADSLSFEIVSQEKIFIKECIAYINGLNLPDFFLYIPANYIFDDDDFPTYNTRKESSFADYVLPSPYPRDEVKEGDNIITLKRDHHIYADRFIIEEILCGRPDFKTLFRIIVEENLLPGGRIYALINKDRMIAYLSCYAFHENIYDVDHVYVLPEYRRQGIGLKLVNHYIQSILASGCVPRYGNAENANSRKLAMKAGFTEVKHQRKYKMIKNKYV